MWVPMLPLNGLDIFSYKEDIGIPVCVFVCVCVGQARDP